MKQFNKFYKIIFCTIVSIQLAFNFQCNLSDTSKNATQDSINLTSKAKDIDYLIDSIADLDLKKTPTKNDLIIDSIMFDSVPYQIEFFAGCNHKRKSSYFYLIERVHIDFCSYKCAQKYVNNYDIITENDKTEKNKTENNKSTSKCGYCGAVTSTDNAYEGAFCNEACINNQRQVINALQHDVILPR